MKKFAALSPKEDKRAYKAKVAEAKSMNSKVLYLEKQMKKLIKNKNVSEYTKLLQKIEEFDSQFEDINNRNKELQLSIDEIKNK